MPKMFGAELIIYLNGLEESSYIFRDITKEEEAILLVKLAQEGDNLAKEKIVRSFLYYCIFRCVKKATNSQDVIPLIKKAINSVSIAITKYDSSKGYRFGTLVAFHIRRAIGEA